MFYRNECEHMFSSEKNLRIYYAMPFRTMVSVLFPSFTLKDKNLENFESSQYYINFLLTNLLLS